ncbi:MAG: WYL domain-containing protein [Victivallales bacterium]|nr:WYL domain-containing protein [Victivallales bacterium]MCF7888483.1 WYL domain-containing protein [Victivallales bacterium]
MAGRTKYYQICSFIERTLFWEGSLDAKYLAEKFNLKQSTAEQYISDYSESAPENINKTSSGNGKYFPSDSVFKFVYPENNYHNILQTFTERNEPYIVSLPFLQPVIDKEMLKEIIRAMVGRDKVLTIRYQSLNSPVPDERNIIPYFLTFVRNRYHLRGYCFAKKDFRDFVLSRIISIVGTAAYKGDKIRDIDSCEYVSVIIKPHTELSRMQKMCTEMEYNMKESRKQIKVRKSLLIYLLDELRIGKEYYKPPFTVLELVNNEQIKEVMRRNNG